MASIVSRFLKRRFTLAALSIILYWILSSPYNTFETEIVLHRTKPEVVWEYVADFSKMKTLNPTILDFNIVKDHGNVHHWQYSVEYTERLSHWPYSKNVALGHFSVLNSEGEFKISYLNEHDTYCQETVKYQCPFLFGRFCRREVEFQRTAIMGNLQKHFKVKTH
ncbi:hypothetical protein pipiens_006826 [Culex pipiens pipiens]|uniref:Uncharacterized protein n=1 Tax=Culex pipiens pipiens TaxID=38569 RepID=A0ABD1DPQ2_CULPP